MKVLITGAAGFVGSTLATRILADADALGRPIDALLLADARQPENTSTDPRAQWHAGDLAETGYVDALAALKPDVVFHLASVPGGAAERDPALGTAVNLHGTLRLIEQLAATPNRPRIVFASTVAVYGAQLPVQVNADTPLRPVNSYGSHKLMTEYLLADLSRRGRVDGLSVRLPGIVARPPQAGGHVSAFMSDIIHRLAGGEAFTCPVSPQATCWWMSVGRCVDNLLHTARITPEQLAAQPGATPSTARSWPLPVLRFSIGELVEALARLYGRGDPESVRRLVRYEPLEAVETVFGRYPPLDSSAARALGLQDDGDIDTLIRRALAGT